ncbi:MAG: MinD/ParA family protein [Deltaproteobacteria bacterium]|jgi:flagellar biosynthesis protein FlhG|nr:MinD/ParA family protein [Deltaproteobacteria bacterium]
MGAAPVDKRPKGAPAQGQNNPAEAGQAKAQGAASDQASSNVPPASIHAQARAQAQAKAHSQLKAKLKEQMLGLASPPTQRGAPESKAVDPKASASGSAEQRPQGQSGQPGQRGQQGPQGPGQSGQPGPGQPGPQGQGQPGLRSRQGGSEPTGPGRQAFGRPSSGVDEAGPSAESSSGKKKGPPPRPVRVITVSSGKGGVGKSNITLALALAMAGLGRKVLIWDADLGLANTDVLLGIRTKATIHDWLKGEKKLSEIIIKGPKGINILPAASGILELNEISEAQKSRLIAEFEEWQEELDFLLIDTAAGIGPNVIFFNLVAQEHLIILNNEPTSITDAYALIKALNTKHRQGSFYLLPNMVSSEKDARSVFELMSTVAGQYLASVSLDLAGYIPYDECVPASVRRQQPFYILYPDCEASQKVAELARNLISREPPAFGSGGLVLFLNRLVSMERAVD